MAFTAREFNYVELFIILQNSLKLTSNLTENAIIYYVRLISSTEIISLYSENHT